jgi:hypothetical protein
MGRHRAWSSQGCAPIVGRCETVSSQNCLVACFACCGATLLSWPSGMLVFLLCGRSRCLCSRCSLHLAGAEAAPERSATRRPETTRAALPWGRRRGRPARARGARMQPTATIPRTAHRACRPAAARPPMEHRAVAGRAADRPATHPVRRAARRPGHAMRRRARRAAATSLALARLRDSTRSAEAAHTHAWTARRRAGRARRESVRMPRARPPAAPPVEDQAAARAAVTVRARAAGRTIARRTPASAVARAAGGEAARVVAAAVDRDRAAARITARHIPGCAAARAAAAWIRARVDCGRGKRALNEDTVIVSRARFPRPDKEGQRDR